MKAAIDHKLTTVCCILIAGMLALAPFHALLTVWAGSVWGGYDWWRLWKELLLLALIPAASYLVLRHTELLRQWRSDPLAWCIAGYVLLELGFGVWALAADRVESRALIGGLASGLRGVAVFAIAWAVAARADWLRRHWRPLVLIPAAVVVGFGLLQAWVLPPDVLRHAGYGPDTIAAFQTVDQKADYVRVQSTLRGPNPLGAYLVVILSVLAGWLLLRLKDRRQAALLAAAAAAVTTVLGYTYSRSAYLGAVITGAVLCWLAAATWRARRLLLLAAALLLVLGAGSLAVWRTNDHFENVFFHTNEHSLSPSSSNQTRAAALAQGARDVLHEPLGRGPGTAGPASVHNESNGGVRIAENYYLQVGQEIGWLGLGVYVAIQVMIAVRLWQRRQNLLPAMLLASLAGLTLVNVLSHAWADDTLGLLWWGLAGVAMALPAPSKGQVAYFNKNQ